MARNQRSIIPVVFLAFAVGGSCLVMPVVYTVLSVLSPNRKPESAWCSDEGAVWWHHGVVAWCDYSRYPGNYDNAVEWRDPDGDVKVLVEVGNTIPELAILPSGSLEVRYRAYPPRGLGKDEWVTVTLRDPDADPVVSRP